MIGELKRSQSFIGRTHFKLEESKDKKQTLLDPNQEHDALAFQHVSRFLETGEYPCLKDFQNLIAIGVESHKRGIEELRQYCDKELSLLIMQSKNRGSTFIQSIQFLDIETMPQALPSACEVMLQKCETYFKAKLNQGKTHFGTKVSELLKKAPETLEIISFSAEDWKKIVSKTHSEDPNALTLFLKVSIKKALKSFFETPFPDPLKMNHLLSNMRNLEVNPLIRKEHLEIHYITFLRELTHWLFKKIDDQKDPSKTSVEAKISILRLFASTWNPIGEVLSFEEKQKLREFLNSLQIFLSDKAPPEIALLEKELSRDLSSINLVRVKKMELEPKSAVELGFDEKKGEFFPLGNNLTLSFEMKENGLPTFSFTLAEKPSPEAALVLNKMIETLQQTYEKISALIYEMEEEEFFQRHRFKDGPT
jgi:hypothetical protein